MAEDKTGKTLSEEKCLVTGSSGFIGSHMVNFLKNRGHWVRGVDVKPKSECYLETFEDEFYQLDLRVDKNAVRMVNDIDYVFHLAANMGGVEYIMEVKSPVLYDNLIINFNMLEAARLEGVERFFFSSSACVYNRELQTMPDVTPLKESDVYPAWPDSVYGWEKLITEIACENYEKDYGLPVRIARFHNIMGPCGTYKGGREKAPAALCRKIAEAQDGGKIEVWGDGKQTRSFLYIDDCCEAFYQLSLSNYSKPVNIGTDRLISIDDLAHLILKVAGKEHCSLYHDMSRWQGVRGRNADLTLIKNVTGWKPKISLEEGLRRTYKWIERMVQV
jgi:nucleoside-diphosphate-sugar epimerase